MANSQAHSEKQKCLSDQDGRVCTFSSTNQNLCSNEHDLTVMLIKHQNSGSDQNCSSKIKNLDDVLSSFKLGLFHWRLLALVSGGYFAACSEMMAFVFLSSPLKKEWDLSALQFSWLPFSTGIAGVVGGYIAGTVSDMYGRRIPFVVGIVIIAASGLASAFAPSFAVFISFRCMVSVGIGTFEAVGFVLLLEFLPRQRRGTLLVVVTLCGAFGAVLAGGFAWLILPNWGWRWFVGACSSPAFLLLCYQPFMFFESPRFLFASGRKSEAVIVLQKMAAINKCEFSNMDNVFCPSSKKPRGQLSHLFSKKYLYHTLTLSTIWFLQATGFWGVTVYLPEYMDRLGADPYFNMFSVFIGEIPGMILAILLIEREMLGRIKTLRFFSAVTAVSLLVFSFIPEHAFKSVLIIICYFSMVPIYSILNTLTPEVYPTEIRSTAMAWVNILIEVPGIITPFIGAQLMSSNLPWLYPVVWGSVFVVQCGVTFFLRNETAEREIEDPQFEDAEYESCSVESSLDG